MPRVPAVPRLVQCFAVWLAVLVPVSLSLVSVALYMLARPLPPASFASAAAATVSRLATPRALTALAAAVLPAAVMARFFQPVRYYLRLTTFLVSLGANSVWGVCVSIIMSLAGRGKDINYVVARSFEASTAPLLGVTLRVEGREHLDQNRPAVLVGNHQTMVDILYLGAVFPQGASIMAKRELLYTPLLGWYMALSKAVFVNRAKRNDAVKVFAKVAAEMKRRSLSLFIFPEGTRSASPVPSLLPFKKGAFHLAVQAQLPIVPIVCENYAHVYHSKAKRFEGGEIVIREGVTSSHEDIQTLTDKTRDAMLAAIEDLGRKRQAQLVADGRARLTGGAGAAGGAAGEEEDGERTRLLQPAPAPASAPTTAAEGEGETASARLDPAPSSSGDEE
ncbi:1-acylglycerol-3-phosphate O-acyltransferase [Rhodotorula sphaerocarpa]